MHGRVAVRSIAGAGSIFTIGVPLSLASSHGLLVRAGKANYALPLDSVQRIVPVASGDIRTLEGRAAVALDGRPLALVHLAELLGAAPEAAAGRDASRTAWYGLLLGSGERQVICLVDTIVGEQELVVQRLPAPLQQVSGIAGATILADGSVVPILDAVDLLQAALGMRRTPTMTPESAGHSRRPTVLVVDDSITTRTLEKNILESAGYQVRLATDGVEALQMLGQMAEDGGCELMLSDVDMPRLNGFDLTAQVRADPRFQHLPVVLVTSLDTSADRERGIVAGADAYIVKRQFEQHTLLETIARLI
jgi:two-component system chemotaxis sensor kinase CheA